MGVKRSVVVLLGCFVLAMMVAAGAYGADVAKIGVVDFQRILKESLAGKAAANILRHKQDQRTEDLKKRREDIVQLQKAMESIDLTRDPSDREQRRLELALKLDQFKEADAMYASQLKDINTKQTGEIREAVFQLVESLGKKGGYLLLLEKNDILYAPQSTDITTRVIEEYNRQFQEKR